jgi:hypothetical protein
LPKKGCGIQTVFSTTVHAFMPPFRIDNVIIESGINQKEALIPPDKHLI